MPVLMFAFLRQIFPRPRVANRNKTRMAGDEEIQVDSHFISTSLLEEMSNKTRIFAMFIVTVLKLAWQWDDKIYRFAASSVAGDEGRRPRVEMKVGASLYLYSYLNWKLSPDEKAWRWEQDQSWNIKSKNESNLPLFSFLRNIDGGARKINFISPPKNILCFVELVEVFRFSLFIEYKTMPLSASAPHNPLLVENFKLISIVNTTALSTNFVVVKIQTQKRFHFKETRINIKNQQQSGKFQTRCFVFLCGDSWRNKNAL